MNFKERGITVGDLLILFIIILILSIVVKAFNKEKKTANNISYLEKISYSEKLLSSDIF